MTEKKYYFEEVEHCEMCGDPTARHRIMGQRLNTTQGLRPRKKTGISVSIKKCTRCRLIYSSPMPAPLNIQDHYGIPPESYWTSEYFKSNSDYFSRELNTLRKLKVVNTGMRALDVGAGIGKCMNSLFHAGFDAYGLEPSISFYTRATTQMNISPEKLRLGKVEDLEYDNNWFDFITFGATFEHFYHPALCLNKAVRWLKPGGVIHIEVPSSKHMIAKIFNTYYRLIGTNYVTNTSPMHSPFHLYEFGIKSFEELSGKLGCRILFHEYYVCDIYHIPKIFHFFLRNIMKWTNTGMQLAVWITK